MKKGKWILWFAWLCAILLLVLITVFNQAKVDKFIGLTSSKEQKINFSYAVQIDKAHVLPGEEIKQGDLLVELIRPDLSSKAKIIDSKINELLAKKSIKINDINGELQSLGIKYEIEIKKLNMQIKQNKVKLNENKNLLQSIVEVDRNYFEALNYKIKSLKKDRQAKQKIYESYQKQLTQKLEYINAPFEAQINELLQEKKILDQRHEKLLVYSPIDGEVGSMKYNRNSPIKAYDTILTVHSKYPKFATGYIHEDIINDLVAGQKVAVSAFNKTDSSKKMVYGTIKSIENRIEEIPVKLKKYKIVPLWGYKVLIELPENNFQLGKKVMITSSFDKKSFFEAKVISLLEFLKLN